MKKTKMFHEPKQQQQRPLNIGIADNTEGALQRQLLKSPTTFGGPLAREPPVKGRNSRFTADLSATSSPARSDKQTQPLYDKPCRLIPSDLANNVPVGRLR